METRETRKQGTHRIIMKDWPLDGLKNKKDEMWKIGEKIEGFIREWRLKIKNETHCAYADSQLRFES